MQCVAWEQSWCRGPDSNRQAVKRRIFFTLRLSTPSAKSVALRANVRALDYAFAIALAPSPARADRRIALGAPRLVSTPSAPRVVATRAGLARRCLGGAHAVLRAFAPGGSPNLRGSAPAVSGRALNFSSPLCLPISSPRQGGRDSTIGSNRGPKPSSRRHTCCR